MKSALGVVGRESRGVLETKRFATEGTEDSEKRKERRGEVFRSEATFITPFFLSNSSSL